VFSCPSKLAASSSRYRAANSTCPCYGSHVPTTFSGPVLLLDRCPPIGLAVFPRETDRESWTYVLRFGSRDVWKIGHTQDIDRRLEDVNQHVPFEDIGERWEAVLLKAWASAQQAYAMEQILLAALHRYRTTGERVRCPEAKIRRTWIAEVAFEVSRE
jgi:hypothetical protein